MRGLFLLDLKQRGLRDAALVAIYLSNFAQIDVVFFARRCDNLFKYFWLVLLHDWVGCLRPKLELCPFRRNCTFADRANLLMVEV